MTVSPLLGFLRALGSVLRASLHPALDADGVERPAHDVIANAREILDAATTNQDQRMLLQIVADTRNVRRDLDAVGQPHAGHFSQRRVRLLWRLGEDTHADAALLRAVLQGRTLRLADDLLPSVPHKLADGRHNLTL